MSQQALDALKATLDAYDAAAVRTPNIPAHVTAREALETVAFVRQTPHVAQRLAMVQLGAPELDAVEQAAQACDRAAMLCKLTLFGAKDEDGQRLVDRAEALEQEVLAACRFNLKRDRDAQAKVRKIADGSGMLDLYNDINMCAELLREHDGAFDDDETFDAAQALAECEDVAPKLLALLTDPADSLKRQAALNLRDRAWTHLDTLLDELRETGRYVLRNDPDHRARFASAYVRSVNARARSAE